MIKVILKKLYKNIPFKKDIFYIVQKFIKIDPKIYRHLHFNGTIDVVVDETHSFKMMHYGYYIENEVFWSGLYGGWEKESLKIWSKLAANSNTIFDIGANTGIYALIAKSLKSDNDVYAFEPVKRIYDKLESNNTLNEFNIKCLNVALSDRDGTASIYDPMSEHLYSVTINKNLNSNDIPVREVEVQVNKLSSIIEENQIKIIDLMKIDVETHEAEVLEGMEKYLHSMQPTMLIEIIDNDIAEKIMQIIKDIGYVYYYIDEVHGPQKRNYLMKEEGNNYLICKEETAKSLGI